MKPIDIPQIKDCSAVLADLEAKQTELSNLINVKFTEQLAIGEEPDDAPPVDPAEARVAALLGKPPAPVTGSKRERLGKLTLELSDLRRALEVLNNQIYVERSKAMRVQRAHVRPEFLRRMQVFCRALAGVHAANMLLRELEDAVEAAGCNQHHEDLRVPNGIGSPIDKNGPLARFFAEAAKAGAISPRDIPAELR
ncbi:MAG: hypothetical protein ABS54_06320 [Hyphomicrobium sp. SCN 65-11]|nr:MAG: hypothetical protein ABS54_06320 [Hyphomicrobium sp. SCN 65-11]